MIPSNLHKKLFRPEWWTETVTPYVQRNSLRKASQLYYSPQRDPSYIMDEDWDNVIILDACRYDMFRDLNTIDGTLDYRISPGSATREFLIENFEGTQYHDTVYVTANPMHRVCGMENVFHDVIDVWADNWNDEKKTVLPEVMAEKTAEAQEKYPNKRILSQFMQPHYPFIGELAKEIGEHAGYGFMLMWTTEEEGSRDAETVWELAERNEVPHDLVWDAFRENLEVALPHVQTLVDQLDGKTVVTSDHGNLLDERPMPLASPTYGHPVGVHCEKLCKVPWLVVDRSNRKRIVEERPVEQTSEQADAVSERLADLGYVDP